MRPRGDRGGRASRRRACRGCGPRARRKALPGADPAPRSARTGRRNRSSRPVGVMAARCTERRRPGPRRHVQRIRHRAASASERRAAGPADAGRSALRDRAPCPRVCPSADRGPGRRSGAGGESIDHETRGWPSRASAANARLSPADQRRAPARFARVPPARLPTASPSTAILDRPRHAARGRRGEAHCAARRRAVVLASTRRAIRRRASWPPGRADRSAAARCAAALPSPGYAAAETATHWRRRFGARVAWQAGPPQRPTPPRQVDAPRAREPGRADEHPDAAVSPPSIADPAGCRGVGRRRRRRSRRAPAVRRPTARSATRSARTSPKRRPTGRAGATKMAAITRGDARVTPTGFCGSCGRTRSRCTGIAVDERSPPTVDPTRHLEDRRGRTRRECLCAAVDRHASISAPSWQRGAAVSQLIFFDTGRVPGCAARRSVPAPHPRGRRGRPAHRCGLWRVHGRRARPRRHGRRRPRGI